MVAINALHGRARLERARRSRAGLLLLLLAAIAVVALAQAADIGAAMAAREAGWTYTASRIAALSAPILCASYLVAGVLIDRHGLRRVVVLALVGWCGVIATGAVALPPIAFAVAAPLAFAALRGVVLTSSLVALRLALTPRRRAPAIALVGIAYGFARTPSFELYRVVLGHLRPDAAVLALATVGTLVAAAWLLLVPDVDRAGNLDLRPSPPPAGAGSSAVADIAWSPLVWSLLAIQLCHSIVYALVVDRYWTYEMLRQGVGGSEVLVPVVATPLATLVAASWSDWGLRRTRALTRARVPFVVLGFVVTAVAAFAATRPHISGAGLALLAAAGIGAIRMADVLEVDCAPRATAGRFLGLLGAGEAFLALYILPIVESIAEEPHTKVPMLVAASLVGAGLAMVLRRRLPQPGST